MTVLSVIKKAEENGLRLKLLFQKIEETLLKKFHEYFPKDGYLLYQELQKQEIRLRQLLRQKVLWRSQLTQLLPASGFVDSSKFDITLLVVLLRQFCLTQPATGWNNEPDGQDWSDGANLVRFRLLRNWNTHGKLKIADDQFRQIFDSLSYPLQCYGCTKDEVDEILTCVLDTRLINLLAEMRTSPQKHFQSFSFGTFSPVPNFHGREETMEEIHKEITNPSTGSHQPVVISGLGGIGKSETCRKYCELYGQKIFNNNVLWINSESESSIQQSFLTIADILKIDNSVDDVTATAYNIYHEFIHEKVLIIFDGVDKYGDISRYLPSRNEMGSSVFILITTQNTACPASFTNIPLRVFTKDMALEFLQQNMAPKHQLTVDNAENLVEFLQYHPLALQQAVSYIRENSLSVSEFNQLLEDHAVELLKEPYIDISQKSVMTTLTISISKLKNDHENESAVYLLNLLCFLNGRNIKRSLIYQLTGMNTIESNKALNTLRRYSLINLTETFLDNEGMGEPIITVHSLVQLAVISNQGTSMIEYHKQILDLIFQERWAESEFERDETLFGQKHWCDHIMHMFNRSELKETLLCKCLHQQSFLIEIFKMKAMYSDIQNILEAIKVTLTNDSCTSEARERLADTEYNIAFMLSYKKRYDEALSVLSRVQQFYLEDCSPSLRQNKKLLNTQSSIASCLLGQKNYACALKIFEHVLFYESKIYPEGDPSLLTTQSNIAHCLMNMRMYKKALKEFRNIESLKLKLYSRNDPRVLVTQANIAYCLCQKRDYQGALKLLYHIEYEQCLIYNEDHPELVNTRIGIERCHTRILQKMEKTINCYSCRIL